MDIGYNMTVGKISANNSDNLTGAAVQAAGKATDDSFEKRLQAAMDNKDGKELKSACQQFESIMLDMMYSQMRATVDKSDLTGDDPGMDIFQSMMDEDLMDQASKTGTFGLSDMLYKQLSKQSGIGINSDKGTNSVTSTGSVTGAENDKGKKAVENSTPET